jgi:peptidoglycan/xylan/chitin deacetylase (PgdA/CDA1 family)
MYHQVGIFPAMKAHRANYCDHRRFRRQMALLHWTRVPVLDMDAVLACQRGERPTPPLAVALTFDDAYANFVDYAMPVLEQFRFPATVYAISDWLGRRAEWFAKDPGRPVPNLMSARQLQEVRAAGIAVGSHTACHVKLAEVTPDVQRRELESSKASLEDLLGEEVRHLCYPYGSFDRSAVRAALESGYSTATTCLRGSATPQDHRLVLPRKAISFGDSLAGFAWKVGVKHAPKPALQEWRQRMAADPLC